MLLSMPEDPLVPTHTMSPTLPMVTIILPSDPVDCFTIDKLFLDIQNYVLHTPVACRLFFFSPRVIFMKFIYAIA